MRNYSEYSEIDKFIDTLFEEGAELDWICPKSKENNSGISVEIINADEADGSAEEEYISKLIEEISDKMAKIREQIGSMPDEADRGEYMTKQRVVSRLIEVSNSIDGILLDMEPRLTANNLNAITAPATTAVIGGGFPAMF